MTLFDLFHEQYNTADGRPVLFECTTCGHRSQSLGSLHAHVEQHWSTFGWFRWHIYGWLTDRDRNKWMEHTRVIAVDEQSTVTLDDVEGL